MGDGLSIQTTLAQTDAVSRVQQGQQVQANADEQFGRKLRAAQDPEEAVLRDVGETERAAIRERERRRQEDARRRRNQPAVPARTAAPAAPDAPAATGQGGTATDSRVPADAPGSHVDVKV